MAAAKNGDTEAVAFLISHEADVNASDRDDMTALLFAAENGHTEVRPDSSCTKGL